MHFHGHIYTEDPTFRLMALPPFIFFGIHFKRVNLGQQTREPCPICQRDTGFSLWLTYRFCWLNLLFCWVDGKRYWRICEECGHKRLAETGEAQQVLTRNPIPFLMRWGWLFTGTLGLLALGTLVVVIDSHVR